MARFKTVAAAVEAGIPGELNNTPLRLKDVNFIVDVADLVTGLNPAVTWEAGVKMGIQQFERIHIPVRGRWTKRFTIRLGGEDNVVLRP